MDSKRRYHKTWFMIYEHMFSLNKLSNACEIFMYWLGKDFLTQ